MIDIGEVMKQSVACMRQRKSLWLFGVFVAGGGGGGGDQGSSVSLSAAAIAVIVLGVIVLLVALVIMNVISEAALIEGVVREEPTGFREGMRDGRRYFGVVLRIKAFVILAVLLALGALSFPIWLYLAGGLSGVVAGLLGLIAVGIGVPAMLGIILVYAFSLRIAVLEGHHSAVEALREARAFLHGRIGSGLMLVAGDLIGRFAAGLLVLMLLVPVGLLAGVSYLVGGVVPAAVVGGLLLVPALLVLAGALGTYRSALWTLGYLAEQPSGA